MEIIVFFNFKNLIIQFIFFLNNLCHYFKNTKPRKEDTLLESRRKIESKIIRYDLERSVSLFLFSTKRNHRNDDPRSSIYCAVNAIIQRNAINEAYTMGDPCFAISLSIPHTLVQLICSTNKFPFVLEYCSPRSLREISRSR